MARRKEIEVHLRLINRFTVQVRPAETDLSRLKWLVRGRRIDPLIGIAARLTGRTWFWYFNEQGKLRLWFGRMGDD